MRGDKIRGLLLLQQSARLNRSTRVNRCIALFDVANDAFLVDHERGARAGARGLVENAVILDNLALLEVAEQREGESFGFGSEVFGPAFERGNAVHADAENLSFSVAEFGDISLIRLHLFRSATGEGKHVKRQHDVLLALNSLSV